MTVTHIIAYEGFCGRALALLQKDYAPLYVPVANKRTEIHGTLQRPPYWTEDFTGYVDRLRDSKGKDESFAILEKEAEGYRYIGHTGIHKIMWPDGIGTTGSLIIDRDTQGKGAGTEAKLLLLHHAFHVLGLRVVKSNVKAWNAKSLGHLVKCGYQMVGRYEKTVFHEGAYVDEILLQVSRESFEPIWAKYQETKKLPKLTEEQRALVQKETNT